MPDPNLNRCATIRQSLAGLAAGSLSEKESAPVRRHVEQCHACRQIHHELVQVSQALAQAKLPDCQTDVARFHRDFMRAIQPRHSKMAWSTIGWRLVWPGLAVLMLAFVLWNSPPREAGMSIPLQAPDAQIERSPIAVAERVAAFDPLPRVSLGFYRRLAGQSWAALDENLSKREARSSFAGADAEILTAGLARYSPLE